MPTRLVARTLASPPQATLCSLGTISFPGLAPKHRVKVSAEAEYCVVANGVAGATWLR
jgi:hypothetical protein